MVYFCVIDLELWFGYFDDDGSDGVVKVCVYE